MSMKIYTKTGDKGQTGLFGGKRVAKDDLRVEAYGTVDELNAVLGCVMAAEPPSEVATVVCELQSLMFELGGELATPEPDKRRNVGITHDDVARLEQHIDRCDAMLPPLKSFILPAGTQAAGALHLARAVCRRAERRCVTLMAAEPSVDPAAVIFLNRASDLLFVLARLANAKANVEETPWQPRLTR